MSDTLIPELEKHLSPVDQNCPICQHPQRSLIERWYMERRPFKELEAIFSFSRKLFDQHGRAVKIFQKRANNTKGIVNIMLEKGIEQMAEGKMEMTAKDLQWAINHRDRILGRIKENVQVKVAPVLHVHTTIPGAGGIADSDVKEVEAGKIMDKLPSAGDLIFEVKATSVEDDTEKIPAPLLLEKGKDVLKG